MIQQIYYAGPLLSIAAISLFYVGYENTGLSIINTRQGILKAAVARNNGIRSLDTLSP
jgi:ribosomal protein S8